MYSESMTRRPLDGYAAVLTTVTVTATLVSAALTVVFVVGRPAVQSALVLQQPLKHSGVGSLFEVENLGEEWLSQTISPLRFCACALEPAHTRRAAFMLTPCLASSDSGKAMVMKKSQSPENRLPSVALSTRTRASM